MREGAEQTQGFSRFAYPIQRDQVQPPTASAGQQSKGPRMTFSVMTGREGLEPTPSQFAETLGQQLTPNIRSTPRRRVPKREVREKQHVRSTAGRGKDTFRRPKMIGEIQPWQSPRKPKFRNKPFGRSR